MMDFVNRASVVMLVFVGCAAATSVHAADNAGVARATVVARDGAASITLAAARLVANSGEADRSLQGHAVQWQFPSGSAGVHRAKCRSTKKGTLIGAAVGGAAGAAFALYVNRDVGGIMGTAGGGNRFLAYWTAGGATGGALVGFVICR